MFNENIHILKLILEYRIGDRITVTDRLQAQAKTALLSLESQKPSTNIPMAGAKPPQICPHYGKEIVIRDGGEEDIIHGCHVEGKLRHR